MVDSRVTDNTIRKKFPYPIAAAWHRVSLSKSDSEQKERLLACTEVLLRTLVAFLLPDYLRGERSTAVEAAITNLFKEGNPTGGKWLQLIREMLRHIGKRQDPVPFMPEAVSWFFGGKEKPSEAANQLGELVQLRNRLIHDTAPVGPRDMEKQRINLGNLVKSILLGMGWIANYRAFCIHSMEPIRGKAPTGKTENYFTGKVQVFAGYEHQPEPAPAQWDAFLEKDSIYLLNRNGVLALAPFIQTDSDPKTFQEHLYLLKDVRNLKKVKVVHDGSGSEIERGVKCEDGEVSLQNWLDTREEREIYQELRIAVGALQWAKSDGPEENPLGDRWKMIGELGRGGMAIVYRVEDLQLGEEVALKVLNKDLTEDATYVERFRREAKNMQKVRHKRIVAVKDIGTLESGQPYIKMDVLNGGSLHDQIKPGGCPEKQVRAWAVDALEALECVHRAGIVHRDVKPSNFLFAGPPYSESAEDKQGGAMASTRSPESHVYLADFGIALKSQDARLTKTLEQIGTLAYMAPEQRIDRTVTSKADVYSLAVVLHELLTGVIPQVPGKDIPGPFGDLILRMGAQEPENRPTAAESLAALRALPPISDTKDLVPVQIPDVQSSPVQPDTVLPSSTHAILPTDNSRASAETVLPSTPAPATPSKHTTDPVAVPLPRYEASTIQRRLKLIAAAIPIVFFFVNYLETAIESWLRTDYGFGLNLEQLLGEAAQWFERGLSFEPHDTINMFAVYGFSVTYFLLSPILGIAALVVFARRKEVKHLLLCSTAIGIDYLITLPFYILFPVPERWTYPNSGAILASDLWTSTLIQAFRPFSGLNNCFPSFHVSTAVIIVACFYWSRCAFRAATLPLACMVILSTFVLGIHWLSDIIAGLALGIVSFRLAEKALPWIQEEIKRGPLGRIRGTA